MPYPGSCGRATESPLLSVPSPTIRRPAWASCNWPAHEPRGSRLIELRNLRTLHEDMRRHGETRRRFRWRTRRHGREFDVVFLPDTAEGMVLLFGLVGGQFAFERSVSVNYEISAYMGDDLDAFKDSLGLVYERGNPFSTTAIFTEFAHVIPETVAGTQPVTHRDIRRTRDVEEVDKIWFVGWLHHGGDSHVSPENLAKTWFYFGEVARRCAAENISSRWSDIAAHDRDYFPPEQRTQ